MTRTRRPLIGLTLGPEHAGGDELSFRLAYAQAIEGAGGAPVLLPIVDDGALERLDGVVFPGGADVDPAEYGAQPHPKTRPNRDLDRVELAVARWAIAAETPILGICRGQQVLNVALGGTLIQHLDPAKHPTGREARHGLHIHPESRVAEIFGTIDTEVNSRHHQAVDRLGETLVAVAWSPDGIVEAVESTAHPWLVAVQFHPEDLLQEHAPSQRLFRAFIAACRRRMS